MHIAAVDGELVTVTPPLEYRHVPGSLRVVVAEVASVEHSGSSIPR